MESLSRYDPRVPKICTRWYGTSCVLQVNTDCPEGKCRMAEVMTSVRISGSSSIKRGHPRRFLSKDKSRRINKITANIHQPATSIFKYVANVFRITCCCS